MLPDGVTVLIQDAQVTVSGPKGEQKHSLPQGFTLSQEEKQLTVVPTALTNATRAVYGLTRATLANMVTGVSTGFEKKLELVGVGYRSQMQGDDLVLSLGYAHPVKIKPRNNVKITIADGIIVVSGINKSDVGQLADEIHGVKPPEPYKGKGIKYVGEYVRRKAGKAAKAVGGK